MIKSRQKSRVEARGLEIDLGSGQAKCLKIWIKI